LFLTNTIDSQDNTVVAQVRISRAAMKAAQEAATAKELLQRKEKNIFHSNLKASVVKLVLFFINLSKAFGIISDSCY
jgi:hypothetical protein